ncbi:MAG: hypothetical protein D6767_00575 [Candidatus Hydrogenedentota bacterium]|nr:MAG: hypothetical protein D6767_00575 [Candidatus Hydrogenedentota bacterium]
MQYYSKPPRETKIKDTSEKSKRIGRMILLADIVIMFIVVFFLIATSQNRDIFLSSKNKSLPNERNFEWKNIFVTTKCKLPKCFVQLKTKEKPVFSIYWQVFNNSNEEVFAEKSEFSFEAQKYVSYFRIPQMLKENQSYKIKMSFIQGKEKLLSIRVYP